MESLADYGSLLGQSTTFSIPYWQLSIKEDIVRIIPRKSSWSQKTMLFLIMLFGGLVLIFIARNDKTFRWVFIGMTAFWCLFSIILLLYLDWYFSKKGPWLVWDRRKEFLELPKLHMTFEKDEIVCFQQLTAKDRTGDTNTEFNVITRKIDGQRQRYPVISSITIKQMEKISKLFSEITGIPLFVMRNDCC